MRCPIRLIRWDGDLLNRLLQSLKCQVEIDSIAGRYSANPLAPQAGDRCNSAARQGRAPIQDVTAQHGSARHHQCSAAHMPDENHDADVAEVEDSQTEINDG